MGVGKRKGDVLAVDLDLPQSFRQARLFGKVNFRLREETLGKRAFRNELEGIGLLGFPGMNFVMALQGGGGDEGGENDVGAVAVPGRRDLGLLFSRELALLESYSSLFRVVKLPVRAN